ncbi:MAG: transposase [Solirubrobacteraceae bacterium]
MLASRQSGLWELLGSLGVRVGELPADLGAIDRLLSDRAVYEPIVELWRREDVKHGTFKLTDGRATIAMETLLRLMVLKVRNGWGYGRLVREVGDSVHLRRFCLIGLGDGMPDESTLRKLVIRLGAVTVEEVVCGVIARSAEQTRFRARAVRIDSTVVEAEIRYPTDAGLAADGIALLARFSREVAGLAGERAPRVRERSRSAHGRLRYLGRSLKRRTEEAKQEVLQITGELGDLLKLSVAEAERLHAHLATLDADAPKRAAQRLGTLLDDCRRVSEQIRLRLQGERITDRLVSLHDTDARPICKGKLSKRTEFGYVHQVCEITSTTTGARGYILATSTAEGNPGENELLPATLARLDAQAISIREAAVDGGFGKHATVEAFNNSAQDDVTVWNPNAPAPSSKRTGRRLYRYRAGAEGRISHLKSSYGMGRSRLKGTARSRAWCAWAILAYNLDTHTVRCTT